MLTPVVQLIEAEGSLAASDVVRWLAEACDALAAHNAQGTWSGIDARSLSVSREPGEPAVLRVHPLASNDQPGRAQVKAVGALGRQMLDPSKAPEPLAQLLEAAITGAGPQDPSALAASLRALPPPNPTQRTSDTVVAVRHGQGASRKGELLGQWELVRLLGEGGMGDVYLARHVRLAREVAIKLLKPELAALPDLVQRFFQEANVVNEIGHPHIVQIQDFVEEPGRVYCVMELLDGKNLADLAVAQGPLRLGRIAFITAQVCDALGAAHRRGVIHRDIKPENIFVGRGPDGNDFARVLDFGIARRLTGGAQTRVGVVMGTPQYMAPEQAAGRSVDARADLYSLGVMLYELLACQSIAAVGVPTAPTQDGAGGPVPEPVRALITSLLSLDPAGRPDSADQVRAVLLPHTTPAAQPRTAPAASSTAELVVEAGLRPRPWRSIALGVAGLALLGGAGWWVASSTTSPSSAPPLIVAPPPVAIAPPVVAEPVEPPPPVPAPVPVAPVPAPVAVAVPRGPRKSPPIVAAKPTPNLALQARAEAFRDRYARLVARHGLAQLTMLERAACQQVVDDAAKGHETELASALVTGEEALRAAEQRLGR